MPLTKGWDCLTPPPNTQSHAQCKICHTTMHVEKNVKGPTSYGEAMANVNAIHDLFTCVNADKPWHIQTKEILMEADKSPSKKITDILREEARRIVTLTRTTKPDKYPD